MSCWTAAIALFLVMSFSPSIVRLTDDLQPAHAECILILLPPQYLERMAEIEIGKWREGGTNIKFITSNSELRFDALVKFVFDAFYNSECVVIGVVGDLDSQTASIIHTLASRANLSITLAAASAPSTFLPVTNLDFPNLLDMNPLQHYIEALVSFMQKVTWTRVGLVSDDSPYYNFAAETLQKRLQLVSDVIVTPCFTVTKEKDITYSLRRLKEYGTHITVLLMEINLVSFWLQEAVNNGYAWPDYAWIILSFGSHCELLQFGNLGVFILSPARTSMATRAPSEETLTEDGFPYCLLSDTVDDSLSAIVKIINKSFASIPDHEFHGSVKFRSSELLGNISITRHIGSTSDVIGNYNPEARELSIFFHDLHRAKNNPHGSTLVLDEHHSLVGLLVLMLLTTFFLLLLTIVLALYVCFRKEPEIKATSVPISLCMFLGCYLSLLYPPVIVMESHTVHLTSNILCNVGLLLNVAALPTSLILATIFAKMLRVYAIFRNPFKAAKRKKLLSDKFLLAFVLLIVTPNILALMFMSILDPLKNEEVRIIHRSHTELINRCKNKDAESWGVVFSTCTILLSLAVLILAVKSNKIRYKHFMDTKQTNAFVFITESTVFLSLVYWVFFRKQQVSITNQKVILIIVCGGSIVIPVACQILLFLPKVYAPLKRWLSKKNIIHIDTVG